jgi:hypothetical protein
MNVPVNEFQETYAVLFSTSNRQLKIHEGLKGRLVVQPNGRAHIDNEVEFLYTSPVQDIDVEDDKITMKTMNSVYVFKKIDEAPMTLDDLLRNRRR